METQAQSTDPRIFERALQRERLARQRAEELLESKARELFEAHENLQAQHDKLKKRKAEIEVAHDKLQSAQVQLVHSEKMASVGQLAAGVAHEINNPVGFVMSNLGSLEKYVASLKRIIEKQDELVQAVTNGNGKDFTALAGEVEEVKEEEDLEFLLEDVEQLIKESKEGAVRVKDIVQGLKSFSRVDEEELKEMDINEGIESTLKVVWNELKYKCEVEKELGDLPPIHCNAGQVNQVIMNLLVNAGQAIEERGKISIATFVDGADAVIRISDSGCGIPEENLSTIFNPFFTTKDVGAGTGLGLSISYGIIQKHNGSIDVQSVVGEGTTFTIRLPLAGIESKQ
ncbi:MAG: ATP-binding protein [Gammaproteobacteria bacterium]|nr:ATP-binding protein [Gammaproteobacteria bacterium]